MQAYYSQTKGYFYTADTETPIGYPYYYGFAYHGSPAYLPQGSSYCWTRPDCDPAQEQLCYDNGGSWNPGTCHCTYPPLDPCRQSVPKGERDGTKDGERPILPCRQAN